MEAEMSVLGALLIDPDSAYEAIDGKLDASDFVSERHAAIFSVVTDAIAKGEPVDIVSVGQELKRKGISDIAYLAELIDYVPSARNAGKYASHVREAAVRRKVAKIGGSLIDMAESGAKVDDIIQTVEGALFSLDGGDDKGPKHIREILKRTFKNLEDRAERRGEVTGLKTGIDRLDTMLNGLLPGKLYVIAGRPSMGKSALANCIASNASVRHKVPSLTFSLEMPDEELTERHICSTGKVDNSRVRIGYFNEAEYAKLAESADTLSKAPIWIDDREAISITEIRSTARRMKRKHGIGLIFVDYLQLCTAKADSRQQEISEISRNLKNMAKELNVPVVALSQLNRSLESRTDKRPMMADLRESGAIEQDADVILFLYRDSVYCQDCKNETCTKGHEEDADIIVAKQRGGPTGHAKARWIAEHTCFVNP